MTPSGPSLPTLVGAAGTFQVSVPTGWSQVANTTDPALASSADCPCWTTTLSYGGATAAGTPTIVVTVVANPVNCAGGPGSFGSNSSVHLGGVEMGASLYATVTNTGISNEGMYVGSCGAPILHELRPTGRQGSITIRYTAASATFSSHRSDFDAFLASWHWT